MKDACARQWKIYHIMNWTNLCVTKKGNKEEKKTGFDKGMEKGRFYHFEIVPTRLC